MIGIFDSGLGGLTIARAIRKFIPKLDIVYFGDTARVPYGNKSSEIIKQYTREDVNFLLERGAKVIVAACHSAASAAHDVLHDEFGRIKSVPVFDVVDPSVRAAIKSTKIGRIGIIGTRATIGAGIYQKLIPAAANIGTNIQIFAKACPLFVPLVEENWVKRPETKMIARAYLQGLKLKKIDVLVMACTHYPFLRKVIQARMGKRVKLIDPGEEVAKELYYFLKSQMPDELNGSGKLELHFSDTSQNKGKVAERWLK